MLAKKNENMQQIMHCSCIFAAFGYFLKSITAFFWKVENVTSGTGVDYNSRFGDVTKRYTHLKKNLLDYLYD